MKKKEFDKDKIFKLVVLIYFAISPIFDIIYLYSHVTTSIRVLCILIFVVITVVFYKDSRKDFKFLLCYYLAMIGYLVINIIHARGFYTFVPNGLNYSAISEAMTLLKLCMPFSILFVLKYQKITRKEFFKVINFWIIFVAGSIVFLNIIGYSLSSYTDNITRVSIFSWRNGLSVFESATKGFFAYSNQVAAFLVILLVFSIYEFIIDKKEGIIFTILVGLASLMLGTRVSSIGCFLVLICLFLFFIIYSIITKRKVLYKSGVFLIIILGWGLILPISPNANRMQSIYNENNQVEEENLNDTIHENKILDDVNNSMDDEVEQIYNSIDKSYIGEQFLTRFYPIEYDKEFWSNVSERQQSGEQFNYRKVELELASRVKKIDGRWTNSLFGIGNSRIQTLGNLERDFVLQYYSFGIVGAFISLLFYLYASIKTVKKFLQEKTFYNFLLLAILALFMFCAYVSGNVFNFMATIVPISFIIGISTKLKDC